MTTPEYLTDAQAIEQGIATALYSTYAEPNRRRFAYTEGTLYAVLKDGWDADAFDYRPAIQWVAVFPPKLPKTGVSWQNDFIGTEQQCRAELAAITDEEARGCYVKALANYQSK